MVYCTVCKKEYSSNFCPDCGQRKTNEKISFVTFISDFLNNIFALDKSLFSNIKCLLSKPSVIINGYLEGYRNYYSSPGKLFILASILVAVGFSFTKGQFFIVTITENSDIQDQFLFLFIFIFLLSATSYLTYYLQWKKNFTKHVIINVYCISLWSTIFTPLSIFDYFYIQNNTISELFLVLYLFLIIIWNNRIFKINSIWIRILYIGLNITLLVLIIFIFTLIT